MAKFGTSDDAERVPHLTAVKSTASASGPLFDRGEP
jgi:hypothetical protein